jgi:hypothetical protein
LRSGDVGTGLELPASTAQAAGGDVDVSGVDR